MTCHGLCLEWQKQHTKRGPKFHNNKVCRTCDVYYPIGSDAGSANICFCCKGKLGIKPRIRSGRDNIYEVHRY